jgi:ribosomal protein S8
MVATTTSKFLLRFTESHRDLQTFHGSWVSKQIHLVAVLLEIGVIDYKITDDKEIVIFLKSRDGRPVLKDLKMVSRPGQKTYNSSSYATT